VGHGLVFESHGIDIEYFFTSRLLNVRREDRSQTLSWSKGESHILGEKVDVSIVSMRLQHDIGEVDLGARVRFFDVKVALSGREGCGGIIWKP